MGESEIVAVTVTLTREDYAAALRVLNEPSSWPKRMLFWLSVVTLGYFCYKSLRLPDHSPLVGILGLVGLAIFVLFVKYGAAFLSARTSVKKAEPPKRRLLTPAGLHESWRAFLLVGPASQTFVCGQVKSTSRLVV